MFNSKLERITRGYTSLPPFWDNPNAQEFNDCWLISQFFMICKTSGKLSHNELERSTILNG